MIGTNASISVKRKSTVSGKTGYPSIVIFEGLSVYMEQVQPEVAPIFGAQTAFETWRVFADRLDIRPGDLLIDDEDNEYKVEGVQPFKNNEIPDHMEIVAHRIYND